MYCFKAFGLALCSLFTSATKMIKEAGLIKTKRSNVAMNCSTIPGGITPVEYSALVIVELFPSLKLLKKDKDATEYQDLLTILETVRDLAKTHDYSKPSLVKMVKDRCLSNLSIDGLKAIIKDSAFCQFPDSLALSMRFKGVSTNPPQLRTDYGDEDYIPRELDATPIKKAVTTKPEIERSKLRLEDAGFDDCTKGNIRVLANKLPETAFVWQAKINYDQYYEIKSLVERIFSTYGTGIVLSEASSIPEFKKVLKYFIAEWYKREYHSNRAISPNIPTALSIQIVDNFKIGHLPVNVRTNWQSCIRALGGLPVFALLERHKSDKTNRLLSNLSVLFDPEDSQDFDATEELFNDKTINRSESIRSLIPVLQAGSFPYDEKDRINSSSSWTFGDFIEKLKTGFEGNRRRKFSIEYQFWLMPGFTAKLTTCIRFKPNVAGEGRNFAINEDRLKGWGINIDGLNQFTLCFVCDDQQFSLHFFKCLNQDWIPYKCENVVATDFPLFKDIHVKLDQSLLPPISFPSRNKGCVQFYSDDHRSWTSRGSCGRYSLVVFDPSLWYSPESHVIEDSEYEYVELEEGKCELYPIGNGEPITFYNAEGKLTVKPKHLFFQEGYFSNRIESQFPCYIPGQDNTQIVYVVDKSGFEVGVIKNSGEITLVGNDEYCKEVYDFHASKFKKIETFNSLSGYQLLRFRSYSYEKTAELRCFFVSPDTSIIRKITSNSREGTISLTGLSGFNVSIREGSYQINRNNNISCDYGITKESSCCKLGIADDRGNQLQLDVVWPYDWADILYKGKTEERLYKSDSTERLSVPAILADRYEHRRFSEKGLQLSKISDDKRYEINSFIHKAFLSDNMNHRPPEKSFEGYAKISLYSKMLQRDELHKYIVDSGNSITEDVDNLKFVFIPIDEGEVVDLSMISLENDGRKGAIRYLLLDIPTDLNDKRGIIVQSLKGLNPQEYYRAAYKPSSNEPDKVRANEKEQKRLANKNKYSKLFYSDKPDFRIALRAFDLALDLECYFGWFDELKVLCSYELFFEKRMVAFLMQYINAKSSRHEEINYTGLWRLAGEFMFDWMLFPVEFWRALIKIDSQYSAYIRRLFLARPGLRGAAIYQTKAIYSLIICEKAFEFRRSEKIENKIAQCIRGDKKDIAQIDYKGKKKAYESFLSGKEKLEIFKKMTDFSTLLEVNAVLSK